MLSVLKSVLQQLVMCWYKQKACMLSAGKLMLQQLSMQWCKKVMVHACMIMMICCSYCACCIAFKLLSVVKTMAL